MSAEDLYPANQWRLRRGLAPHNHRPPRPPNLGLRPMPPAPTDMICLFGLLSPAPSIPPPLPQPNYNHRNMYGHQPQTVIVDIIKSGNMQIEYTLIFNVYRQKHFILKSDSKLYYFASPNEIHKKPDGVIDLTQVTALRKIDHQIFEMRVRNKTSIFTADTTIWKFKCDSMNIRNEWFDCIRLIVSKNKKASYIERKRNEKNKNKDDEWCIVEKKENEIYSNVLEEHKQNDIIPSAPNQPGMSELDENNVDNPEKDGFVPPPAFAPGFNQEGGAVHQYGDEGKPTSQQYYM